MPPFSLASFARHLPAGLLSALALFALAGAAGAQMTYTNPVIAPVAADPSVARAPDGSFVLAATQDSWGSGPDHLLPIFRSADLVHWEFLGDAFAQPPGWKAGGGFLWAPDLGYRDGRWELYYAYSQWGDANPCIGMATAERPEGPWSDLGRPVFCSDDIGVANSIDPFLWFEDGERTLLWGSFHGIYAVALDAGGAAPAGEPVRLADDRFEAATVIERDARFYLFVSSGSCCEGSNSTYTTWVGRSESLLGPYLDREGRDLRYGGGEVVLFRNDAWVGPGHNTIARDDAGTDWIVYHAIDPTQPTLANGATRRPLLVDALEWSDGWPRTRNPDAPSAAPQPAPEIR